MLLVAATALMTGCAAPTAAGLDLRTAELDEPLPVEAILVRAVQLRSAGATSWETFERTQDLLAVITRDGRLAPIGPTEVSRLSDVDDDALPYDVSTLGNIVDALGLPRDAVLVLRSSVEPRVATLRSTREGRSRVRTEKRGNDETLVIRLRLIHAATGRDLASLTLTREVDPLQRGVDPDPTPWVTEALEEGLRALLEQTTSVIALPAPLPAHGGPELHENPRAGFDFRIAGLQSFADREAALDPVSAEAERLMRYERADPTADAARTLQYDRSPLGLLVTSAPPEWPLRAGDVITEVDGRPTLHLYQWYRALRLRRPADGLSLRVDRSGQQSTVSIAPSLIAPSEPVR